MGRKYAGAGCVKRMRNIGNRIKQVRREKEAEKRGGGVVLSVERLIFKKPAAD